MSTESYTPLSLKFAVQLAAPHTWPASILPVFIAMCAAAVVQGFLPGVMVCVLLLISILMQAAVNTMNDYYDFVKGADSKDDNVEVSDAVLVYNNVNPRSALALAIGFLVVAFVLGIYVIVVAGWIPLVIAIIGAFFVVLYSAGKTPISYLPVGEVVSGVVMGGLICLASYTALTGTFTFLALLWALPVIIGVGLIMMTNNTCDIEKDIPVDRHTLPVLLGREKARGLYHALMVCWVLAIIVLVACFFTPGLIVIVFMLPASWPQLNVLWKNPLVNASRIGAMGQIAALNLTLGAFYGAAILASRITLVF